MTFVSMVKTRQGLLNTTLKIGGVLFFAQLIYMMLTFDKFQLRGLEPHVVRYRIQSVEDTDMQSPHRVSPAWSLSDVDKQKGFWEGLSEKELQDHGLRPATPPFQPFNPSSHADPLTDLSSYDTMSLEEIEIRFDILALTPHIKCLNEERMGHKGNGGWNVCTSSVFKPREDGLVYSFGINYDYSFDDAMARSFKTYVHAFDPTMIWDSYRRSERVYFHNIGLAGVNDPKTKTGAMLTLEGAMEYLCHEGAVLEMWKFDIEYWEFDSLNQVIRSGILRQVKQLAFEIHMHLFTEGVGAMLYQRTYEMLLELERQGFRKFRCDINTRVFVNPRTGRRRPGSCFEMYYINLRFLK